MGLLRRTKSLALVSLLVGLVSLVALGFLFERILRVNTAVAGLRQSIKEEGRRDIQLRAQQSLLKELSSDESALDSRFLDENGVVPFIELLEAIGKDAGVTIEIDSVGIEPDSTSVQSHEWLRVALKAEGSWAKLFHFIVLLETIPQALRLDQVSLSEFAEEELALWQGTFIFRAAKRKNAQP